MMRCFAALFLFLLLSPFCLYAGEFRVGVMPAKESLPFYAEEKLGIFKKHGIDLVIVPFRSALERDSAFVAGKIDGAINDIVGTILLTQSGRNIKIMRAMAKPSKEYPVFKMMKASGDAGKKDAAVSYNTVIEYVTDRIMEKNSLKGTLKKTEIKSVPLRMQLLLDGKVGYATLAEPLGTYAGMKGASEIYTDWGIRGSHVLFVARGDMDNAFLNKVLVAYDETCVTANREKMRLKGFLWTKLALPTELKDNYALPDMLTEELPGREDVGDVQSWMRGKKLIKEFIDYDRLVFRQ